MSWFTKTVEVEKVVTRTLLGSPEPVILYKRFKYCGPYGLGVQVIAYYEDYAQALAEKGPYEKVEPDCLWKIGQLYLSSLSVVHIEVKPKPKRDKGKARAA